jgi:F-type H+-transporting ATPase subunit b
MMAANETFIERLANYISIGMPPLQLDGTLIIQIVNLLALMFILQRFFFKPVKDILEKREAIIKGNLNDAKTAQDKAEAALRIMEDEILQAKQKASAALSDLRQQGMAEQIKIVETAKEHGKLLIEKGVKEIEKSTYEAKAILLKDAEGIASEITSKMLGSAKAILSIIIILAIPSITHAAGGGEAGHAPPALSDWLFRIINFAVLAAVLGFLLFKFGKDILVKRRIEVERQLREAEETRAAAKKRLAEIEERIHKKEEEIKAILEDARMRGEREKTLLIEEGNKVRQRLESHAKARIEQELKKAKEELHIEAVNLAIGLAEKKIKKDFGSKEQDSLIEEYIIKIGEKRS